MSVEWPPLGVRVDGGRMTAAVAAADDFYGAPAERDFERDLAVRVRLAVERGYCANCGYRDVRPEAGGVVLAEGVLLCHLCGRPKSEGGRGYGERPWGRVLLCIAANRCPADLGICGQECPR